MPCPCHLFLKLTCQCVIAVYYLVSVSVLHKEAYSTHEVLLARLVVNFCAIQSLCLDQILSKLKLLCTLVYADCMGRVD